MLILIRKPFRPGDQIIAGDFEGTVQDIDLRACKTAVEGAGMSIPWPIRTLAPDPDALAIRRGAEAGADAES